ncbi:MAG TPA: type I polyketide synthase, partial [Kofleriaceae bacterium]|nr:type I polyketide synthase [Kofleriaceae bacterium]
MVAPASPRSLDEPIAIVGLGCRYPGGVEDAESFWRLLEDGVDAVTEVPADRWDVGAWYDADPEAAGKMTTRWGGFLSGLDRFDPGFFGISPREAVGIDPRLRLLLETTWEALEGAGISADQLDGSDTGVFMGLVGGEYQARASGDVSSIDVHDTLGSFAPSMVQRISYWLGLKGPNMPVETACSSSLVAVHLACQALRTGECQLALAGGANVLLDPEGFVAQSRMRVLSPTGRCRTFSADADGIARSEGAGVVVLERLSDARRNGHRVRAVIRGSAVNQDGRSNGMTAPNGPSQEAVIREALRRGGVAASAVGYLECHGTGTPLGDPIEVQSAAAVLGEGRREGERVILGSLKSNIGHAEGAAGIGGLIKAVLALEHGRIPKTLHVTAANPHIPWDELAVEVATEAMDWPRRGRRRIAGVSSFGISGTNAHVVLEEAPREPGLVMAAERRAELVEAERSAELVVVSGQSEAAVAGYAERLRAHVERHPEQRLGDVAYSLATGRAHHAHRLAVSVRSRDELVAALAVAAGGELPAGGTRGEAAAREAAAGRGKVMFVFPGQGGQWAGMGRELLDEEPVFRDRMAACDRAIRAEAGWSVLDELRTGTSARLAQVDGVQPALFAIGVSLAALWRSWGIEPSAVVGHSQGEVAAAYVAGALSLEDAVAVICRRSQQLVRLTGRGGMAMVQLGEAETRAALGGYEDALSVAAVNSRRTTVISGAEGALDEVLSKLEAGGVFCKRVKVDYASHSPQVEALREALVASLSGVRSRAPEIAMRSTVTGRGIGEGELGAEYWADNLRQPVRFAEVVAQLLEDGHGLVVEVSPHPVVLPALEELRSEQGTFAERIVRSGTARAAAGSRDAAHPDLAGTRAGASGTVVGSLVRGKPERGAMLAALGALHVHGARVDWTRVFAGGGRRVALPGYAWQRERYWIEARRAEARAGKPTGHPLLGARVAVAGTAGRGVYESVLSRARAGWIYDHVVAGRAVMPGAGLAELMRAAAEDYLEGEAVEVRSLVFAAALVLAERGDQRVQVVVSEDDGGLEAAVYSQACGEDPASWTQHATGAIHRAEPAGRAEPGARALDVAALRARCAEPVDVAAAYATFAAGGIPYGPAFRGLQRLGKGSDEAL